MCPTVCTQLLPWCASSTRTVRSQFSSAAAAKKKKDPKMRILPLSSHMPFRWDSFCLYFLFGIFHVC